MTEVSNISNQAAQAQKMAGLKDAQGRYRTQSLFKETRRSTAQYPALFSLRPGFTEGFPSLHDKYMELEDPTEYKVAIEVFGCWEHWEKLLQCKWFMEELENWREELRVKLHSQAIERITTLSQSGNDQIKYAAAKTLLEQTAQPKNPVGRPKKGPDPRVALEDQWEQEEVAGDAKRIGVG